MSSAQSHQHGVTKVEYSATLYRITADGNEFLGDINDQESELKAVECCKAIEGVTDWIVLRNQYRFDATAGRWAFERCALASTTLPRVIY